MAAIVIQPGILRQQLFRVISQIECGVVTQGLDPQHFAQAQYRVKAGAAHTVVQRTVHGGKGNAYRKSELAHAFILLADLFTDDSRQIIHCLPSFTLTFSVVQFPILDN